jgi:hypothetical protein
MNGVKKICYVCGLALNDYPYYINSNPVANPEMICPSCGTHYGLDDLGGGKIKIDDNLVNEFKIFSDPAHIKIIKLIRQNWIKTGMNWWSQKNPFYPKPENWNPNEQMKNIPSDFQ